MAEALEVIMVLDWRYRWSLKRDYDSVGCVINSTHLLDKYFLGNQG